MAMGNVHDDIKEEVGNLLRGFDQALRACDAATLANAKSHLTDLGILALKKSMRSEVESGVPSDPVLGCVDRVLLRLVAELVIIFTAIEDDNARAAEGLH